MSTRPARPTVETAIRHFGQVYAWNPAAGKFTLTAAPGATWEALSPEDLKDEVMTWWVEQAGAWNAVIARRQARHPQAGWEEYRVQASPPLVTFSTIVRYLKATCSARRRHLAPVRRTA
jgi:hypothetical protein